ncbi:hypothetical protein Tco_0217468 [Tanacetum coccineum]
MVVQFLVPLQRNSRLVMMKSTLKLILTMFHRKKKVQLLLEIFRERKYPLSVNLIEKMLDHQLEICHGTVGNELTTRRIVDCLSKKQMSDSKRLRFNDWLLQQRVASPRGYGSCKDFLKSVNGCDELQKSIVSPRVNGYLVKASSNPFLFFDSPLPGVNTPWDVMRIICNPDLMDIMLLRWFFDVASSWNFKDSTLYVVPTGRVKVLAGRYVVPTGKDNVIVSAGRTKVIPAGRTILVLVVLCLLRGDSIVS